MEKANQALKQRFEKQLPGTKVEINAGGSDGAIAALLDGKIDLAAIGRPLIQQEKAQGLVQVPLSRQKMCESSVCIMSYPIVPETLSHKLCLTSTKGQSPAPSS